MAIEIERKFLVRDSSWKEGVVGKVYHQGYLSREKESTVRVRRVEEKAFLTIKGAGDGLSRPEYEYEIPLSDGQELLETLCEQPLIEKIRYLVHYAGMVWEVDEFLGENSGLVVAEIELSSPAQSFEKPPWLGVEVTGEPRYYNACLCGKPFCTWDI